MKNNIIFIVLLLFSIACKNESTKQAQSGEIKAPISETKVEIKSDSTHVHTYVCPMHPEVTSTKEGEKCPKCGMDLVHQDK